MTSLISKFGNQTGGSLVLGNRALLLVGEVWAGREGQCCAFEAPATTSK